MEELIKLMQRKGLIRVYFNQECTDRCTFDDKMVKNANKLHQSYSNINKNKVSKSVGLITANITDENRPDLKYVQDNKTKQQFFLQFFREKQKKIIHRQSSSMKMISGKKARLKKSPILLRSQNKKDFLRISDQEISLELNKTQNIDRIEVKQIDQFCEAKSRIKQEPELNQREKKQRNQIISNKEQVLNLLKIRNSNTKQNKYQIDVQQHQKTSLEYSIYEKGTIQLQRVKNLSFQIFQQLHQLHMDNKYHGHICSENILLQGNKLAFNILGKYTQFQYGNNCSETAPEVIMGSNRYNQKADVWAVGCVIAEMITGRKIFTSYIGSQDVLVQIFKCRGSPSQAQLYSWNKRYSKILQHWRLPMNHKRISWDIFLEQEHLESSLIELLDRIFEYNPNNRISVLSALNHHYFDEIRNQISLANPKNQPIQPYKILHRC